MQAALIVLAFGALAQGARLPSYVKPCSRSDPKLNECALKHGRELIPMLVKGDPNIRLPQLDPMLIEKLQVNPSGNTQSIGLQLTCDKCLVAGLGSSKLNDIKIDLPKRNVFIKLYIPKLIISGHYNASGRVLVLPISGNGNANITIYNLDVEIGLDIKYYKKKGVEHFQVSKYKVTFTGDGLKMYLENLLNDKNLSENMNAVLNENWRDVLNDVKPAISDTIGEVIKLTLNQVSDVVPFDDLFLK